MGNLLSPGRAARAARTAATAGFDDAPVEVPCQTCPQPLPPAKELDGALMGAGCTPMTQPRERGRLKPRTVVDTVDSPAGYPVLAEQSIDPPREREPLSTAEIRAALANPVKSDSRCCERLREQDPRARRTIVYVNGIGTPPEAHCASLRAIADATCANVIGVYNATDGMLPDLQQSRKDVGLIHQAAAGRDVPVGDTRNPAVDTMHDLVVQTRRNSQLSAGEPIELWAHSQGGAITSLALYRASATLSDAGVRNALGSAEVNSFGSAAPRWPDGPRYMHHIHTGDLTPTGLGFAGAGLGRGPFREERVGKGATVVLFSGKTNAERPDFAWRDIRFPPPTEPELWPVVSNDRRRAAANHGMDGTYLSVYRQRARTQGHPTCPELERGE